MTKIYTEYTFDFLSEGKWKRSIHVCASYKDALEYKSILLKQYGRARIVKRSITENVIEDS